MQEKTESTRPSNNTINILYLTTRCNLDCEYCYERANRLTLKEDYSISHENIRKFIDNLADSVLINDDDSKNNVPVVIQGGEPYVEFDLVKYTIMYAAEKYPDVSFGFNILSNGLFFGKESNILRYKNEILATKSNNHLVSQDISYDRTGHTRRNFPNGKNSREKVEKAIMLFKKMLPEEKLRLRYTIHRDNCEPDVILRDWVEIIELYKPDRLITSNFEEEAPVLDIYYKIADLLFKKYGIPICEYTCEKCSFCQKQLFRHESSGESVRNYMTPSGGEIVVEDSVNEFDHFTKTNE